MNELKTKTKPEQFYTLDNTMSLEKILRAKETKEPIIGKVLMWHSNAKFFDVDLGNGLCGVLPVNAASIYPAFSSEEKLSAALRAIIGKTVVVSVVSVNNSNTATPIIVLSRKDPMLSTYYELSNSIGKTIECCITSFCTFGVFVDAGNGVSGLIVWKHLSVSRLDSPSDLGFAVGNKITATILSVDENFHVSLDYKNQFENLALTSNTDDLIVVKTLKRHNYDGYFVFINPNTSGLMDVPSNLHINYGDNVVARVKGPRPNNPSQLRLTFVSMG